MDKSSPRWMDLLLTAWIVCTAIVYYGGYFYPAQIGVQTGPALAVYAFLLLCTAVVLALRYLKR